VSSPTNPLFEQALRLPEKERAELAHRLLESLEPESVDEDYDSAWAQEIERRVAEIKDGTAPLLDLTQGLAQIRAKYSAK
jgi:putative addiction module component (TIGR02574 family)